MISKQGSLPAPETVIRHWNWNWHIDTHHADLNLISKSSGRITITREDCRAIAVLMFIDHVDSARIVSSSHNREHRTEYLFLVDSHVGGDVVEQATAQKITIFVTLQAQAATIYNQFGASIHTRIDETGYFCFCIPMQRSPAEPKPAPIRASTAWFMSASGMTIM